MIRFKWDPKKDISNQKKHKVSFSEAKGVFYDGNALLIHDPEHSEEEDRFILLGLSFDLKILVVCHCYLENDQMIRIISARKANRNERKQYEERL